MNSALPECPEKNTLRDFLLGKLPEPDIELLQTHLSQCPPCGDTIRSLDAGDTLDELARDVMASSALPSVDNDRDQWCVDQLVSQLKQRPLNQGHGDNRAVSERASEVTLMLAPSDVEGNLGRLAHYEIQQLLGAGGTGVVYRALDTQLQRTVVLKVLRPSLGANARQRFMAEAQSAARIDHDHVVTIFHVGQQDSLAYMAMQWLPGETLESRLANQGALDNQQSKAIVEQITKGLAAAHDQGLIHRDIKPANIWIQQGDDRVKILDFGLARVADDDPQFTDTGMIAGTPTYMSPEQARGAEIDQRSDLFSLGSVLYRMTTGQLPFQAPNVLATLQSIQRFSQPEPRELNPSLDQGLNDLAICLLQKRPASRPQSADAVLEALNEMDSSKWSFSVPARQPDVKPQLQKLAPKDIRGRNNFVRWAVAVGFIAILIAGGMMYGQQIIRIATGKGQIVIETFDENVEVHVMQDEKTIKIIDASNHSSTTIDIAQGTYQLEGFTGNTKVWLTPEELVLSRGGIQIVKVHTPLFEPNKRRWESGTSFPGDMALPEAESIDSQTSRLSNEIETVLQQITGTEVVRPLVGSADGIEKRQLLYDQCLAKFQQGEYPYYLVFKAGTAVLDEKIMSTKDERVRYALYGQLRGFYERMIEQFDDLHTNPRWNFRQNVQVETFQSRLKDINQYLKDHAPPADPLYQGKPLEYWIALAEQEKGYSALEKAAAAFSALASEANADQVIASTMKLLRSYGVDPVSRSIHPKIKESGEGVFVQLPANKVVEAMLWEIRDGNINSRRAIRWIINLADRNESLAQWLRIKGPELVAAVADVIDDENPNNLINRSWANGVLTDLFQLGKHDPKTTDGIVQILIENSIREILPAAADAIDFYEALVKFAPDHPGIAQGLVDHFKMLAPLSLWRANSRVMDDSYKILDLLAMLGSSAQPAAKYLGSILTHPDFMSNAKREFAVKIIQTLGAMDSGGADALDDLRQFRDDYKGQLHDEAELAIQKIEGKSR